MAWREVVEGPKRLKITHVDEKQPKLTGHTKAEWAALSDKERQVCLDHVPVAGPHSPAMWSLIQHAIGAAIGDPNLCIVIASFLGPFPKWDWGKFDEQRAKRSGDPNDYPLHTEVYCHSTCDGHNVLYRHQDLRQTRRSIIDIVYYRYFRKILDAAAAGRSTPQQLAGAYQCCRACGTPPAKSIPFHLSDEFDEANHDVLRMLCPLCNPLALIAGGWTRPVDQGSELWCLGFTEEYARCVVTALEAPARAPPPEPRITRARAAKRKAEPAATTTTEPMQQ
jgi:hypothetical protein